MDLQWLDTKHHVFTLVLSLVCAIVVYEFVLPDSWPRLARFALGWLPAAFAIEFGLARYMGWSRTTADHWDPAGEERVSHPTLGRP